MAVQSLSQAAADPAPGHPALMNEVRADVAIVGAVDRSLPPIPPQAFTTPAGWVVAGWYQLLDAAGR